MDLKPAGPISLYNASIPVFLVYLNNLSHILKKGSEYADGQTERLKVHEYLAKSRLHPTMEDLVFQVQRLSDTAKFFCTRCSRGAIANESWEDNEKTLDDLQERIKKTIKYLERVKPEELDGKEGTTFEVHKMEFNALGYFQRWAMPNFFFHVMTTYSLLRAAGVPIGKMDYLMGKPRDS